MLDVKFVLDNVEDVRSAIKNRNLSSDACQDLDKIEPLNKKRLELVSKSEGLKATRNKVSQEIALLKKNKTDASQKISEMKKVSDQIKSMDDELRVINADIEKILLYIPNILHSETPIGKDESDNVEIRKWGDKPNFSFKVKDHIELGENLGMLDFEKASGLASARFSLYRGQLASLERALINFMIDIHIKNNYEEIIPPFLVNSLTMQGTGQLPKFSEELFKVEDSDLWLIPTGEVPLTNIYKNTILKEKELPKHFVAYTPCFRREAGSYGKDVRGLIRLHQFNKVELVKYTTEKNAVEELNKLTSDAENILKVLNLPYRVIQLCSGDINASAVLGYDIEVWIPSQNCYREISSCSYFSDYQARRAKIRYKPADGGKTNFVHTINGSGLAIGRCVVAILENYQQEDGSIVIPEPLRNYMGGVELISK